MPDPLRIGILADASGKLAYLTGTVTQAGHQVAISCLDQPPPSTRVDAWVVDVALESPRVPVDALETFLADSDVPVLVCDSSDHRPGSQAHTDWLRRMTDKLVRLGGELNLQRQRPARHLWVLAASTGGPAAVKAFVAQLPARQDLALLYVQHLDAGFTPTLTKMMAATGAWRVQLADTGLVLSPGSLTIVSAQAAVELLDNGTLAVSEQPWGGCYAPSVDQLAANVARVYRRQAGLIVFTGMGDDGAAASRLIRQQGGRVWVQTPASCVSSSMPESVLALGGVERTGTPEQLAAALAEPELERIEDRDCHESTPSH